MRTTNYLAAIALAAWTAAAIALGTGLADAQAAKKFEPSELQHTRLELKLARAELAHDALTEAQANFYKALTDFNEESRAIVKANNWPDTVVVNPKTLEFSDRPLAPAGPGPTPAPEVKPDRP